MDVQERWWHRLAKAGLAGCVGVAGLVLIAGSSEFWSPYTQSYSWQKTWSSRPDAKPCIVKPDEYVEFVRVDCGDMDSAADVHRAMVDAEIIQASASFDTERPYVQGLIIEKTLRMSPQQYHAGRVFNPRQAATSISIAVGLALLLALAAYGAWRLLLYVCHGRGARLIR